MEERRYVVPEEGAGHGSMAASAGDGMRTAPVTADFEQTVNAKLDAILAALADRRQQ